MKIYPEELKAYQNYLKDLQFEYFSDQQKLKIKEDVRALSKWHHQHPYLHNLIGSSVLLLLISLDLYFLTYIPLNGAMPWYTNLAMIVGHGITMYNIIGYTLHEGAYHRLIFIEKGRFSRGLGWMSRNICRLWYCDPDYYTQNHHGHHVYLGTRDDGTFTQTIHPKRFFTSLGPLASALNYNDYKLHTGEIWTKSKIISETLSFLLVIGIGLNLAWSQNYTALIQYVGVIFFGTWISFILDRIRETTEHNLMPNDSLHGAREFGLTPGGLLFGGGPWGQPCHLTHHIAPSLPWYQQLRFHFRLNKIMTPHQQKQFGVHPLWGVPVLLKQVLSKNAECIKGAAHE